jgi:hypothetical protein
MITWDDIVNSVAMQMLNRQLKIKSAKGTDGFGYQLSVVGLELAFAPGKS